MVENIKPKHGRFNIYLKQSALNYHLSMLYALKSL